MTRRAVLLALLGALVLLLAWDRIHLAPAPERPPPAAEALEPRRLGIAALSLERHPGRVADDAGLFTHYRPTLRWLTQSWLDDLGIDFHVATLDDASLPVDRIAAEALTLRRVGADAPTGGILLVLNPARAEARIEVSYALESALPDALVGRLAEDQLAPYAGWRAAGMATMDVLHFLKDVVLTEAVRGRLALDAAYTDRPAYHEKERFLSGGAGAGVHIPDAADLAATDPKQPVPESRRARYAPSADPLDSVEALLRSRRELAGDPSLPLFTPGSQCMKRNYPYAPYEEIQRAERLAAGRPWRVQQQGDRAVVTASKPVHGFVPVLLHRIDGRWRVDTVETWKNLFFDGSGSYFLKNANTPYAFGLASFGQGEDHDVSAWDLGGAGIERVLAALAEQEGALFEFLQGEVYYRNCFLPDLAIAHYERALEQAPNAPLFAQTLGDRASYLGFHELAIRAYQKLARHDAMPLARGYAANGQVDEALQALRRVLERNPLDTRALTLQQRLLEQTGAAGEAAEVGGRLAALRDDPQQRHRPIELRVEPADPEYVRGEPTQVGRTKVYDHAVFAVTLHNPSGRPVTFSKVVALTQGTGGGSGLGDIRSYWQDWGAPYRLAPGQSLTLERTWGFTVPTQHQQLSYVFDLCWQGEGDPVQCRTQRVDLLPR